MCKLRVKEILTKRGWKQRNLADRMRIGEVTLSRILTRGRPDYDTLERMADALECDIADFFERSRQTIICSHCGKR